MNGHNPNGTNEANETDGMELWTPNATIDEDLAELNGLEGRKPGGARRVAKAFFIALAVAVGICAALLTVAVVAYNRFVDGTAGMDAVARALGSNLKHGGNVADLFAPVPKKTNFIILGVDGEGGGDQRTDFMMAGCFDSESKRVTLISIPRDTKITMDEASRKLLSDNGRWTPANGVMKINEAAHYAGGQYAAEVAVKQAEGLLGVEIRYYVRVDLAAFRELVDAMGGVWFDVPQRMVYDDPEQNLHINLEQGYQLLDGAAAEGVCRYRKGNSKGERTAGYTMGDLTRVRVQQDLMRAIISQAFSKDAGNFTKLAGVLFDDVRTNFPAGDIPKYAKYLSALKAADIDTYTLPGEPSGGSPYYVLPDTAAIAALVSQVYYGDGAAAETSVGKTIRVLNGGDTAGLAAAWQAFLTDKGFTVSEIGDYNGARTARTRIVSRAGLGADLKPLFADAQLEAGDTGGADIVVILGSGEPLPDK